MIYYKTHKIPVWVILHNCKAKDAIKKELDSADAYNLKWIGQNFKESVMALKTKGWHVTLNDYGKNEDGIVLSPDLITKAYADHVIAFNSRAYFSHGYPLHRVNRVAKNDQDFQRIFDEVFSHSDPVTMSQNLGIGELCADTDAEKRYMVVYTDAPVPTGVVKALSDNYLHVGDGEVYDVDVSKMKSKEAAKVVIEEILSLSNIL